jgi:hypothetical protein
MKEGGESDGQDQLRWREGEISGVLKVEEGAGE